MSQTIDSRTQTAAQPVQPVDLLSKATNAVRAIADGAYQIHSKKIGTDLSILKPLIIDDLKCADPVELLFTAINMGAMTAVQDVLSVIVFDKFTALGYIKSENVAPKKRRKFVLDDVTPTIINNANMAVAEPVSIAKHTTDPIAKPEPEPAIVAKPEPEPAIVAKPEPEPAIVAKPSEKPVLDWADFAFETDEELAARRKKEEEDRVTAEAWESFPRAPYSFMVAHGKKKGQALIEAIALFKKTAAEKKSATPPPVAPSTPVNISFRMATPKQVVKSPPAQTPKQVVKSPARSTIYYSRPPLKPSNPMKTHAFSSEHNVKTLTSASWFFFPGNPILPEKKDLYLWDYDISGGVVEPIGWFKLRGHDNKYKMTKKSIFVHTRHEDGSWTHDEIVNDELVPISVPYLRWHLTPVNFRKPKCPAR